MSKTEALECSCFFPRSVVPEILEIIFLRLGWPHQGRAPASSCMRALWVNVEYRLGLQF